MLLCWTCVSSCVCAPWLGPFRRTPLALHCTEGSTRGASAIPVGGCRLYSPSCREGVFSKTELPVLVLLEDRHCRRHCAFAEVPAPSLPSTSKSAYYNKVFLANRRSALSSTLRGIYPTRKGTPGAREKSALTEEHTQEQQEELSCPNCSAQLPDEAANFCPECGAELPEEAAQFCSNCGEELPDEAANFCPKCGAEQHQDQQTATEEEPTQPSDEEERTRRRGGPEGPSGGPSGPTRRPSGPSGRISGPSGPSDGPSGPSRSTSGPSRSRGRRAKEGVERAREGVERAREGVERAKEGAAAAKERARRAKERARER